MARRVGNLKSIRAAVGASADIVKGTFVYLDGWLGVADQSIKTNAQGAVTEFEGMTITAGTGVAAIPAQIILNIEPGEYETSQITVANPFAKGNPVYWVDATKKFTTVYASGLLFCGNVTVAKDASSVIWFGYVGGINMVVDVPVAAAVVDVVAGNAQGIAASLNTGVVGDNNALTWTAQKIGTQGNAITVALVNPLGNNQALSVVVTNLDIVVNLATGADGAITSTGATVKAGIMAEASALALVSVGYTGVSTGAEAVVAVAETHLAGGVQSEGQLAVAKVNALMASLRVVGLLDV